jgi:hypothetical protein
MKKKVEFKKTMSLGQSWNFRKETPTKTIVPELKQNIKEEESFHGILRQWISFKNNIVGIIELSDGSIEVIPSSNIKFLKKQKKSVH